MFKFLSKIFRRSKRDKQEEKDQLIIKVSEPWEVKHVYRPIVEKVIPELVRRLRELGIEPKNVSAPIAYGSSLYRASFGSWENLRLYKILEDFTSIDDIINYIKKMKNEIVEVSFEWENHYAITNYYLRVKVDFLNLMIKLYPYKIE